MSDLIERLRKAGDSSCHTTLGEMWNLLDEAADEISSLSQRLANEEHRVIWRDVRIDDLTKNFNEAFEAAITMYNDNVESQNCDYSYLRELVSKYPWLEETKGVQTDEVNAGHHPSG